MTNLDKATAIAKSKSTKNPYWGVQSQSTIDTEFKRCVKELNKFHKEYMDSLDMDDFATSEFDFIVGEAYKKSYELELIPTI